jgi:hypothetical protein
LCRIRTILVGSILQVHFFEWSQVSGSDSNVPRTKPDIKPL